MRRDGKRCFINYFEEEITFAERSVAYIAVPKKVFYWNIEFTELRKKDLYKCSKLQCKDVRIYADFSKQKLQPWAKRMELKILFVVTFGLLYVSLMFLGLLDIS